MTVSGGGEELVEEEGDAMRAALTRGGKMTPVSRKTG